MPYIHNVFSWGGNALSKISPTKFSYIDILAGVTTAMLSVPVIGPYTRSVLYDSYLLSRHLLPKCMRVHPTFKIGTQTDYNCMYKLMYWLSKQQFIMDQCTSYSLVDVSVMGEQRRLSLPGIGYHIFYYKGERVRMDCKCAVFNNTSEVGARMWDTVEFQTSSDIYEQLMRDVEQTYRLDILNGGVEVYTWHCNYRQWLLRIHRLANNVIDELPAFMDLRAIFENSRQRTQLGVLCKGVPGTGKTTAILYLAKIYRRSVYHLPLLHGDQALCESLRKIDDTRHPGVVIVLEDIDRSLDFNVGADIRQNALRVSEQQLLNVFTAFRRSMLVIATTNNVERVDSVLGLTGHHRLGTHIDFTPLDRQALQRCTRRRFGVDNVELPSHLVTNEFTISDFVAVADQCNNVDEFIERISFHR